MHLRSGKVTVAPPLPWPRPSDVIPQHFETAASMSSYFGHLVNTMGGPESLSKRRLVALNTAETLFANPQLLEEPHAYSGLIGAIINKFEDPDVIITTFNKQAYIARLRSINSVDKRKKAIDTLRPKIIEWACRPRGPLYRVAEKSFYANAF